MTSPLAHPTPQMLQALARADLGPEATAHWQAHLAGCLVCEKTYRALDSLETLLRETPSHGVPYDFAQSVMARIAQVERLPRLPWWRQGLSNEVLLAGAIGVGGALVLAQMLARGDAPVYGTLTWSVAYGVLAAVVWLLVPLFGGWRRELWSE